MKVYTNLDSAIDGVVAAAKSTFEYVRDTPEIEALRKEFDELSNVVIDRSGTNVFDGEARMLRTAMSDLGFRRMPTCKDYGWDVFYQKGDKSGATVKKLFSESKWDATSSVIAEYHAAISALKAITK